MTDSTIEKAQKLIGHKYDEDDFNCYTLVQHFYPQLLDAKLVHKSLSKDLSQQKRELERLQGMYEYIKEPEIGCLVLRGETHIGIMVTKYMILHTCKDFNTIVEPLSSFKIGYNDKQIKFIRIRESE